MKTGILHIKKRPRHILFEGKQIPIKKEIPEIGKEFDKMECQFEGNPAIRIIVGGKEFAIDMEAKKRKEAEKVAIENYNKEYQKMIENQKSNGDSFVLSQSRVPKDTREKVLVDKVDNFYLKLNQFARWEIKDNIMNEEHFKFFLSQDITERRGRDKKTLVKEFFIKSNFKKLFEENFKLSDRILTSAKTLFPKEGQLVSAKFKPEWRFVTGLGGHSVYETGITLHHIYGVPYIPASSIKGVLRSWVIYSVFDNDEKKALNTKNKSEDFCHLFGCPAESALGKAYQGDVIFFDALPTKAPTIEPDIMNPHYPRWYSGEGKAPVDTESPVPIFFLTVKDTPFQFIMATKPKQDREIWDLNKKAFWGKTLMTWLTDALSEHGIGAKTAVGYGYMTTSD